MFSTDCLRNSKNDIKNNNCIYLFRCIREALKEKAVILVTHQLHFLKNVDKIIVLHKGEMVEFGTYDELMLNTNGKLYMLLEERREESDISNLEASPGSNTTLSAKSESKTGISKLTQNVASREETVYWDNIRYDKYHRNNKYLLLM